MSGAGRSLTEVSQEDHCGKDEGCREVGGGAGGEKGG